MTNQDNAKVYVLNSNKRLVDAMSFQKFLAQLVIEGFASLNNVHQAVEIIENEGMLKLFDHEAGQQWTAVVYK